MKTLDKIAQAKEIIDNNKVNIYYCSTLSEIYFNDFKRGLEAQNKLLMLWGRHDIDYMIFADMYEPYFNDERLEGLSESELIDLYQDHVCWNYEGLSDEELKKELKQSINIKEYCTKMHEDLTWHDLECDYIFTGYSQGDAVKVLNLLNDDTYIPQKDDLRNLFF